MPRPHVLLLGGTTEGRWLAQRLAGCSGVAVTTSLAGRVRVPAALSGPVRVGGFGGADGLAAWVVEHDVAAVLDATHPFAATMTAHAAAACAATRVPLLRVERPAWAPQPDDDWHDAGSVEEAARLADRLGGRLLVTTGRQEAAAFAGVQAWCLLRSIDPPAPPLPARHEILLDRGPFTLGGERTLLRDKHIDVIVTKNSGGAATAPKLLAAREAALPVVVVRRPPVPPRLSTVVTGQEALRWLGTVLETVPTRRS